MVYLWVPHYLVDYPRCGLRHVALAITRLISPSVAEMEGSVFFSAEGGEETDLLSLPEEKLAVYRGKKIAYIFQEPGTALNPVLTIQNQLEEVLEIHQGVAGRQAEQRREFLLREVGIPHPEELMKSYPHQLSGGMKQRIMIAMALACNPSCLVADEPTSQLDVTIQVQILLLLKKIQKEHGLSMIFITHDLGVVEQMADKIAVMYEGQIVKLLACSRA
jgi:ABC-type dipeptide/oligopeptide/nickel transport system ATPase component